jgi:hypothetical protein
VPTPSSTVQAIVPKTPKLKGGTVPAAAALDVEVEAEEPELVLELAAVALEELVLKLLRIASVT